jgi:EAL domain-containing protein (putative c-di-GMP-specific phosphodiesterase class I)
LANFQPDIVKIDMALIRDVDHDPTKQAIVRSIVGLCGDLGISLIAEGVETPGEYVWLRRAGIELIQGYLFAKPGFECLPEVAWQPNLSPA